MKTGGNMGRKRIDPLELIKTICINLPNYVLTEISKEGKPKTVIEKKIIEIYGKKE